MGGLGRVVPSPNPIPERPQEGPPPQPPPCRSLRRGPRPAEQARAEVEPRIPPGAWDGAGCRPALLLRALHRSWWDPLPVHGRRAGRNRDRAPYVRGRRALVPPVASVPSGVRVKGVAGGRLWEARVGRTCDRVALRPVPQGLLVRRLRNSSGASGKSQSIVRSSHGVSA